MRRCTGWICVVAASLLVPAGVRAQDTPAAKATRERVKKTVIEEVDWKDTMTREIFNDIKRESGDKISFYIDNTSGMSNNTRMTYKGKNVAVEKILNELADKNDFGWYVVSDKKDRRDGFVLLRKSKYKERGFFEGKEPKKAALPGERYFARSDEAMMFTRFGVEALRVGGVFIRED